MPGMYNVSCQKYGILHTSQNDEVSFDNSYNTTNYSLQNGKILAIFQILEQKCS
jgi:hypothetical protein